MAERHLNGAAPAAVQKLQAELAELSQLARSQARTLSAGFYTSPEYLKLERDRLFRDAWICVGHIGAVANVGDYFTTEFVDEQLLVVRDTGATVKVLANVCRHRGSRVMQGAGTAARLTCAYHGWTYALDGRLMAAPLMKDGASFDKKDCALKQFTSEVWQGYIFVDLAGTAPPLAPQLRAIEPYIRNYHPAEQHFLYQA